MSLSERITDFRSTWKPYCKRYSPLLYRDADWIITQLEAELELEQAALRVLDGTVKGVHKLLHKEQQENAMLREIALSYKKHVDDNCGASGCLCDLMKHPCSEWIDEALEGGDDATG